MFFSLGGRRVFPAISFCIALDKQLDVIYAFSMVDALYTVSRSFPKVQTALKTCGEKIAKVVVEKNAAYGDASHKVTQILKILYPEGVTHDRLQDMLILTRVLDKLVRIACGNKKAFGESPWSDVAGYGIIGMAEDLTKEGEDNV